MYTANRLLEIVYRYYPPNVDRASEEHKLTSESLRLSCACREAGSNREPFKAVVRSLQVQYPNHWVGDEKILPVTPSFSAWVSLHPRSGWSETQVQSGSTTNFNNYFGVSRFQGRNYYGGHSGSNNDNHYNLFSAGGMDFIVISFKYDSTPDQPVLDWADALLKAHPNRRAIVASHYIVGTGNPASFGTQGQAIYDNLKDNPNLFLLVCGHICGEGRRSDVYQGRTVYSILTDYQCRSNGGNGWLRTMTFSPASDTITFKTYSPTLNQWETDADSQFTLTYDMPAPTAASFVQVGAVSGVAVGNTASVTWNNLSPSTSYEWYAEAFDGQSTVPTATRTFTTAP